MTDLKFDLTNHDDEYGDGDNLLEVLLLIFSVHFSEEQVIWWQVIRFEEYQRNKNYWNLVNSNFISR